MKFCAHASCIIYQKNKYILYNVRYYTQIFLHTLFGKFFTIKRDILFNSFSKFQQKNYTKRIPFNAVYDKKFDHVHHTKKRVSPDSSTRHQIHPRRQLAEYFSSFIQIHSTRWRFNHYFEMKYGEFQLSIFFISSVPQRSRSVASTEVLFVPLTRLFITLFCDPVNCARSPTMSAEEEVLRIQKKLNKMSSGDGTVSK